MIPILTSQSGGYWVGGSQGAIAAIQIARLPKKSVSNKRFLYLKQLIPQGLPIDFCHYSRFFCPDLSGCR